MNKYLALIAIILIPIALITYDYEEELPVASAQTLENKLEITTSNSKKEEEVKAQVLVSQNNDKSNAYYIDLEEYIIGVVAGEMPASFNMEALKAQAVASRTYAMYKMSYISGYVLSTSINDQVYLSKEAMQAKWGQDYNYYYNRIKQAVEATKGEVLTYNGSLAITYYFAISNGYTDDGMTVFKDNKDYLVSVESNWDKNYSYISSFTMNQNTFCNLLNISCNSIEITSLNRADNHYVRFVTINGKTFTGIEIFNKLNLKSHDFDLTVIDSGIYITTYGFGHGVGMSQYGAQGMSSNGYKYEDILTHYYQNTKLSKL